MIFAEFVKPFIAMVISLALSLGSLISGPAGNYEQLALKTLGFDPMHTHVDYTVDVNAGIVATLAGVDITAPGALEQYGLDGLVDETGMISVPGAFDVYTDLENIRLALELESPEGENYGIYLDPTAFAVSPELTGDILPVIDANVHSVYEKHVPDYGFYFDFDEALAPVMEGFEEEVGADKFRSLLQIVTKLYGEIFGAFSSDEGVEILGKVYKLSEEVNDKFYSETEVDGVKAYTCKITGKEYLEVYSEALDLAASPEFIDAYVSLLEIAFKNVDFNSLFVEIGKLDGMTDEEMEEALAQIEGNPFDAVIEEMRTQLPEIFASADAEVKPVVDALITGEGLDEYFGEYGELVASLLPIIHGTTVSSTLYEKDGKIIEDFELVVGANGIAILSVAYTSSTQEYDGEVKSPAQAVPFGKRLTLETIENKVAFEDATTKGVGSIEIEWDSDMLPEYTEADISNPLLYVNYKTTMWDAVDAMEMTDEEKALYKQYFAEDEYEYNIVDTSAVLIENSVYLPLRQLMENAGYEVSWDADARKAYVTVNGEKIEMTGTIVNDKTYVKVRDFEKLGAKVDYEETIYSADDWNSFSKTCYATITFN